MIQGMQSAKVERSMRREIREASARSRERKLEAVSREKERYQPETTNRHPEKEGIEC